MGGGSEGVFLGGGEGKGKEGRGSGGGGGGGGGVGGEGVGRWGRSAEPSSQRKMKMGWEDGWRRV